MHMESCFESQKVLYMQDSHNSNANLKINLPTAQNRKLSNLTKFKLKKLNY